MSKIDALQTKLYNLNKSIEDLELCISEKTIVIDDLNKQITGLQDILHLEKTQLEDYSKKLTSLQEMRQATDNYYKQLEQNIDTLMTILTGS